MNKHAKIYVAGHSGLVGSAIIRTLAKQGFTNVVTRDQADLDLRNTDHVTAFFNNEKPQYVFIAAARVGGVLENDTYPADFIHDNLSIATNLIHAAHQHNITKLLYLGSSCIYPRDCPQPIKEEYFMTGPLETTNQAYATAKIAGIKMCQAYRKQYNCNFISAMPTNLYGPNDNFDLTSSHVLPALLRKFAEAKAQNQPTVTVWGTGKPRRELMYVDDLAAGCLFLMEHYNEPDIINIGTGHDISIAELAELLRTVTGFAGSIVYDTTKPDGTPRKWLDVTKLHTLGFHHTTELEEGVKQTYQWYQENVHHHPARASATP